MLGTIEFYFDFVSPYAYLASGGLGRIASTHGFKVIPRPILLWVVLEKQTLPAPLEAQAKRDYLFMDMHRTAEFFGVPYSHPKIPVSSHLPARVFYAINETDPDMAARFAFAGLDALFAQGIDINVPDELARIVDGLGPDGRDIVERSREPSVKAQLARANDEAVAKGVFGSPFYFVDGERFFGADRLPQLEWHLRGRSQTPA